MRGIGIDFGTTNSVIAVADDDGAVHAMSWPSAEGPTPTCRTALAFRVQTIDGVRSTTTSAGPAAIAWALDPAGHQRFVQSMRDSAASMRSAGNKTSYEMSGKSFGRLKQSCDSCHRKFR